MEEDDDFGELYSDVLLPFPSPPSSSDHPIKIDQSIIKPEPNPNPNPTSEPSIRWNLNLIPKQEPDLIDSVTQSVTIDNNNKKIKEEPVTEKEEFTTFDIEENDDLGTDPMIRGREEEEDWDSDSDDDLQIVLDDDKNIMGMMMMNEGGGGGGGGDEEGENMMMMREVGGEMGPMMMEERDWGEDGTTQGGGGEGERKEGGGDGTAKLGGGLKIGFNNTHSYHHPYHSSQFKYVRPGAAPIPGAAPVGPGQALGQVRPPVGPVAGRGRGGEWRPPGMKGFHSGFAWGNNGSGRGFGIGLDFTLPSHKTIFEVDINGFEEKPWKLAGIDVSDFFNFGLNEESWKDYCKQLEILRMGASMPSKIRVYESGRTEQEYDPDLPPELAAAAGVKEIVSENTNAVKIDAGQSDLPKECGNMRPSMPTGRPIQVETGFGERLPSIDSRQNRIRDSDAIIEIVLEGLENDPVQEDVAIVQPEHDLLREGSGGGHRSEEKFVEENNEHFDGDPLPYRGRERDEFSEGDGTKSFSQEARTRSSPNSRGRSSSYPEKGVGAVNYERRSKSRKRNKSLDTTISRSTQEKKEPGSQKEGSVESVGVRRSPHVSSPVSNGSDEELDVELVDDSHDDLSRVRKEKIVEHVDDSLENPQVSLKRQRGSSRVRQSSLSQDFDDGEESKAVKNVENRKSRSGSERDYHKARGSDKITVNMIRSYNDDEHLMNPRNYDERHEMGKRVVETVREDPFSYRDWDPPHGRKERDNNPRKRELVRNKVYENERLDKDEYYKLNKHMNNNGSSRVYYEKDMGSQYRGRDDNMKNRYETIEDPYRKRRKEDENMRRDVEKEETYHLGRNREYTNNRKRERDDAMDPRKREGGVRSRDEGNHSSRYKEEDWVLWERERQRAKHSHEESLPKRERVESRDGIRGGRAIVKDKGMERDYHFKRRDNRVEDSYIRGDQVVSDERESKPERDRNRSDLENSRSHHKRHKESSRKGKESEGGERNSMGSSRRSQEVRNGQVKEPMMAKGTSERGNGRNDISKNYKVDVAASSDEEQQDSRKGRSKLERWTSHQERDFATLKKPSSSLLAVKEAERYNSSVDPVDNNDKHLEPEENHHSSGDTKEVGDLETKNTEPKAVDNNNDNNKHLETVEKLKKRSERFKLPMPSEKETVVVKKMENEPSPSAQDEAPPDLEIKPERPARKRRWISS